MRLTELRSRIHVGTRITCIQNTYNPKLANSVRVVEKVQRNGYWFRVDGKRVFGSLPERASQIVDSTGDTLTFRLFPKDPDSSHTVTIRIEAKS